MGRKSKLKTGLKSAARVAAHCRPHKDLVSAVGAGAAASVAVPLLATAAAPVVLGAVLVGGAYLGARSCSTALIRSPGKTSCRRCFAIGGSHPAGFKAFSVDGDSF
jgi:hypothetical protein